MGRMMEMRSKGMNDLNALPLLSTDAVAATYFFWGNTSNEEKRLIRKLGEYKSFSLKLQSLIDGRLFHPRTCLDTQSCRHGG